MLERERLESKKISKTNAVTSIMGHELPADDVYIGPSDYVPWLTDRKWAHIRARGPGVRRRAAPGRAQARGLGLAELGRHRHRRRALLQARAQPGRRGPARRPELLPHEVAATRSAPTTRRARRPRRSSPTTRARARPPAARARRGSRRPRRVSAHRLTDGGCAGRAAERAARSPGYACARGERALRHRAGHAASVGGRARGQRLRAARCRTSSRRRGHRVVVLAPSRSPGAGARVAAADPRRRRCSTPTAACRVLGVGELLPLAPSRRGMPPAPPLDVARTLEDVLTARRSTSSTCTSRSRRAPSSVALRHSRALNVGTFHAPTERVDLDPGRARASWSASSAGSTRARPRSRRRAS